MPPSGEHEAWTARRWLQLAASLAATAGLLAWVIGRIDRSALWTLLGSVRPGWLLLAAALVPLQAVLAAERWRLACDALGQPLRRGRAVREVALSVLLNQLLPGGVSGDAIRAWRARTGAVALAAAVRGVVVDRVIGLGVHMAVVAAGLLAWPRLHSIAPPPGAVPIAACVSAALVGLGLLPARLPLLGRLASDLRTALSAGSDTFWIVALSFVSTASFLAGFAACGRAVGASLGPMLVTAIPLVLLAMAVPIGVGGWGLREATAALILPQLGLSAELAVALSACYGAAGLLGSLPGALVPVLPAPPEPPQTFRLLREQRAGPLGLSEERWLSEEP